MAEHEDWRDVPGFEGVYQVSNLGRVKSIKYRRGRIVRQWTQSSGYAYVGLGAGDEARSYRVHRVVMLAFVGPCPDGQEVSHKNHNRTDNRLSNLEYVTHSQNMRRSWARLSRGERHPSAKLTAFKVRRIRELMAEEGTTAKALARRFGVSPAAISQIRRRKTWAWLDAAPVAEQQGQQATTDAHAAPGRERDTVRA